MAPHATTYKRSALPAFGASFAFELVATWDDKNTTHMKGGVGGRAPNEGRHACTPVWIDVRTIMTSMLAPPAGC